MNDESSQQVEAIADDQLIRRFVERRDQDAFSAIVHRYHGLVLGVCSRNLANQQDAEDAFQAVFLTLVRSASSIRKRHSLASWLYGVAYRVSRRMCKKRRRDRTESLEDQIMVADDPFESLSTQFAQEATDRELNRLPDRLREPMVLRYLVGRSNAEVAQEMRLSVSAVEGRLKRGRNQLRMRLARNGITLGLVAAALEASRKTASADTAQALVDTTISRCLDHSAGTKFSSDVAQSSLQLAREEALSMTITKLSKVVATGAVLLGASTLGLATRYVLAQPPGRAGGRPVAIASNPFGQTNEVDVKIRGSQANLLASNAADDPFGDPLQDSAAKANSAKKIDEIFGSPPQNRNNTPGPRSTTPIDKSRYDLLVRHPTEARIETTLRQPAKGFDFFEVPLADAVEQLADVLGEVSDFSILLDRDALDEIGIDTGTPVTAEYQGISYKSALRLMLKPLDLEYVIKNEVLMITTVERAEEMPDVRIYPMKDEWNLSSGELIECLTSTVAPSSWEELGGPGAVTSFKHGLVIRQTQRVHEEIESLLRQFDAHAKLLRESRN